MLCSQIDLFSKHILNDVVESQVHICHLCKVHKSREKGIDASGDCNLMQYTSSTCFVGSKSCHTHIIVGASNSHTIIQSHGSGQMEDATQRNVS